MPNVYFLVGVPGSGKSTWVKNIQAMTPDYAQLEVVSFDAKIMQLAEIDNIKDYATAWQKVDKRQAEKMVQAQFENLVSERKSFIIDMTNLSKKSRNRKLAQIPKEYTKYAVVFEIPKELMLERNEARKAEGKYIHPNTLDDMFRTYEKPSPEEGFVSILFLNQ